MLCIARDARNARIAVLVNVVNIHPRVEKTGLDPVFFLGYDVEIDMEHDMTYAKIYEINVDLDGVLANFIDRAVELTGINPESSADDPAHKLLKRSFWKTLELHVKAGNKFFETLDPMHDAFVLWDYLGALDVPKVICSATGHLLGAKEEKRAWVRTHLGHETANAARFVRDGKDKAKYAASGVMLIDDRMKVLRHWIDAGGVGILHTSAESTIAQLKEYGL